MALDTIESDKYTPLRKIINQMGNLNYIVFFWMCIYYACYLIKEFTNTEKLIKLSQ